MLIIVAMGGRGMVALISFVMAIGVIDILDGVLNSE